MKKYIAVRIDCEGEQHDIYYDAYEDLFLDESLKDMVSQGTKIISIWTETHKPESKEGGLQ
jgi:hypothetical protein